jgi:MoaA/NifB/PqqE/SkfB family radical SAM enzyme
VAQVRKIAGIVSRMGKERVRFGLAGGEPFLLPELPDMVRAIVDSLYNRERQEAFGISVLTNFFCSNDKIAEFCAAAGDANLAINVSVHFGQFDVEKYFEKAMRLPVAQRAKMRFKLLLGAETFSAVCDAVRILEQTDLRFWIALVHDHRGRIDDRLSPRQKKVALLLTEKYPLSSREAYFSEFRHQDGSLSIQKFTQQERLVSPDLVAYQGLWCAAGYNALRISPDGGVRRCFPFQEEFNLDDVADALPVSFTQPFRCPRAYCVNCGQLLGVPKWAEAGQAPSYMSLPTA